MKNRLIAVVFTFAATIAGAQVIAHQFPAEIAKAKTVRIVVSIEDGGGSSDAAKWQKQASTIVQGWGKYRLVPTDEKSDITFFIRRGTGAHLGMTTERDIAEVDVFIGDPFATAKPAPAWTETNEATWNALPGVLRKLKRAIDNSKS